MWTVGKQSGAEMAEIRCGFVYGPASVERLCDTKAGVFIAVTTERETMEIRVTPGGRISVYDQRKNPTKREVKEWGRKFERLGKESSDG